MTAPTLTGFPIVVAASLLWSEGTLAQQRNDCLPCARPQAAATVRAMTESLSVWLSVAASRQVQQQRIAGMLDTLATRQWVDSSLQRRIYRLRERFVTFEASSRTPRPVPLREPLVTVSFSSREIGAAMGRDSCLNRVKALKFATLSVRATSAATQELNELCRLLLPQVPAAVARDTVVFTGNGSRQLQVNFPLTPAAIAGTLTNCEYPHDPPAEIPSTALSLRLSRSLHDSVTTMCKYTLQKILANLPQYRAQITLGTTAAPDSVGRPVPPSNSMTIVDTTFLVLAADAMRLIASIQFADLATECPTSRSRPGILLIADAGAAGIAVAHDRLLAAVQLLGPRPRLELGASLLRRRIADGRTIEAGLLATLGTGGPQGRVSAGLYSLARLPRNLLVGAQATAAGGIGLLFGLTPDAWRRPRRVA